MDGGKILSCISSHASLKRSFGAILASDDVRKICDINIDPIGVKNNSQTTNQTNGKEFFTWIRQQFNDDRTFPLGYILNTGTHQNGGQHWQALYFDVNGISYFFDSYGREAKVEFKKFEILLRSMYHFLNYFNFDTLKALSQLNITNFIQLGLQKALNETKTQGSTHQPSCVRYWDHQIQDDNTNVCGQYSTFFLYNITSSVRDPPLEAYKFFAEHFFYFKSKYEKDKTKKELQSQVFKMNDRKMATLFQRAFGYIDKNIMS